MMITLRFMLLLGVGSTMAGAESWPVPQQDKDFVYVCTDAGAGAYEAFPDVCRLADGRLMCVFYAGWTHVSLPDATHPKGGRVAACYSSDEGRTWSPAVTVYDGPDDDRDPSCVQLPDGRILVNFFSLRAKEGGGYADLGSWLVESSDNGQTWSAPMSITSTYYCSAPIRVLSNGELILGLYREGEGDANGAAVISSDGGKTWGQPIDIANGGLRLDAETDIIELRDGQLYAVQRTEKESMRYSTSSDKGRTWSVSVPIGYSGHSPYLHRTPNDVIVCAHRLPQTSLHYSFDECKKWIGRALVDDYIGAYPSMVNLEDGSTLIVYYEEGKDSSIRARRFKVDTIGLHWLKWE